MASLAELSAAKAILLAANLCASGNVTPLLQLRARFPAHLSSERLLRIILTFLPESIEPQNYTSTLEEIVYGPNNIPDTEVDVSPVKDLSETLARKRVRKLRLLPLRHPDDEESTDLLTQFLIHRAHLIDAETSLQPLILELLLPFYDRVPAVRTFLISNLLPLLRLNYEYYPSRDEILTLEILESMDDHTAINVLLSMTSAERNPMDLLNNLRGLLGPWMYGSKRSKRRKLNETAQRSSVSLLEGGLQQPTDRLGWQHVNDWLLSRSLTDRESVVSAYVNWDGPGDVDLGGYDDGDLQSSPSDESALRTGYGQAGLAVVYATSDATKLALEGSIQILFHVAKLLGLDAHSFIQLDDTSLPSVIFDTDPISSTSRASLLLNALLLPSNPLTQPCASSVSFLSAILLSLRTLNELGHFIPCRAATNVCLHSNEEMQLADLRNVVTSIAKHSRPGHDWRTIRQQVLWLRSWQSQDADETRPYHGLFWRVARETAETEILKALLDAREYPLAVDIYTGSEPPPLDSAEVESAVTEAIFTAYDNASNGNRTRGGMKKAFEM